MREAACSCRSASLDRLAAQLASDFAERCGSLSIRADAREKSIAVLRAEAIIRAAEPRSRSQRGSNLRTSMLLGSKAFSLTGGAGGDAAEFGIAERDET
jgi:hypothetical protein